MGLVFLLALVLVAALAVGAALYLMGTRFRAEQLAEEPEGPVADAVEATAASAAGEREPETRVEQVEENGERRVAVHRRFRRGGD